ncbi:MAG TPA: methyltransferase, TIGR04325 family [Candidatus Acidoferrales bacterium]|nr:methyltransferase, TIGR04325 family [Candidatus Acidoferrales bacterium]
MPIKVLEGQKILHLLLERLYKRRFRSQTGAFRGVFPTFEQANRSAPRNKPLGFNCSEYAGEFRDRHTRIFSFDYPVLYWLSRLLQPGVHIFDYGGHLGTHFYAYARYLTYPPGLTWTVCDLPEITRAGEQYAREQDARGLAFTNRPEEASGADILIAAGSLQYIESPSLSTLLSRLDAKPRHLLLNKLPLYNGEQFVTLQNGGAAFHPQYVFNRHEFLASLTAIGYRLEDAWDVETHSGRIPLHPGQSFRCHSGLYLCRSADPAPRV